MSYVGMIASVVGNELQGWSALLDKWRMQQVYQQQATEQQGFRNKALGLMNPQASSAQAMMQGVGQGAKARESEYGRLNTIPLAVKMPGGATAGPDAAYTNLTGGLRAKVGGYSDWAVQQSINNLRTQQMLNDITQQAGGAASIFPLQMYSAQHSHDVMSAIGQAISSLGGGAANFASTLSSNPTQGGGGGRAPTFSPMGSSYSGYQMFPGFTDAYGNTLPQGWNTLPTGFTAG